MSNSLKLSISPYANPDQPTRIELEHDFKVSARTSIARRKPNAPLQIVLDLGLIEAPVLNYGKGRGSVDSDSIRARVGECTDYDFTFCPLDLTNLHFKSVVANYVINTLPPKSRFYVWKELANVVRTDGVVYVAARSDKDKGIRGEPYQGGVITSIGTYQVAFTKESIQREALQHFEYVELLPNKSGFVHVRCSHSPFPNK
ncbi:hypothetical protein L1D14_10490 [Vibrio tubiashii]|uniref:hypothetical protein n=1 Tax=Vibrio tubiashii TaxID=29498 RepID=UPI001EFDF776|nr:hypothetical protein [Vibrio tubiashii]MCG9576665.1 hypothetical protein [Vibrio tubiashii]